MNVQNNDIKVDIVVNVYGKPWQTLCTITSLLKHSGQYIDRIFFIEESTQPYDENVSWVVEKIENCTHYKPIQYQFLPNKNSVGDLNIDENRYVFRYQYGIEKTDKKYVFITHNDVLYSGDIIGDMLKSSSGSNFIGIGSIGQCWNCPGNMSGKCNGEKIRQFDPNYSEILELMKTYPPARGEQFVKMINKESVMPLPECRLNEFACLLNAEYIKTYKDEFFGSYDGIDLGCKWFEKLYKVDNSRLVNYDIQKKCTHGYWANTCGYRVQLHHDLYIESEKIAKEYYYNNFQE